MKILYPFKLAKLSYQLIKIISYIVQTNNNAYPKKTFFLTSPKKIRIFLERSGPAFIKLGQILSTRPDIISKPLAEELSLLQDKTEALPFEDIKLMIEKNFDKKITELYKSIDPIAVASASVAQVHKALDFNGNAVAIKCLKPNIKNKLENDLKFISWVFYILSKFSKTIRNFDFQEIIKVLQKVSSKETNLIIEAATIGEFHETYPNLSIPKVYWNLTSKNILTETWIEGTKINSPDLNKSFDTKILAKKLVISFLEQVYKHGFFHADPHPGNIIAFGNNNIAYVDFGIVGRLTIADQIAVLYIVEGFIRRDYNYIAKIHRKLEYFSKDTEEYEFAQACRGLIEPIFYQPTNKISIAKLLKNIIEMSKSFSIKTQPQLILMHKTMALIESLVNKLAPETNIWKIVETWIKSDMTKREKYKLECRYMKQKISEYSSSLSKIPKIIDLTYEKIKNI